MALSVNVRKSNGGQNGEENWGIVGKGVGTCDGLDQPESAEMAEMG